MLENLVLNILAEFFALLILIIIGWVFVRLTHRRRLLRFFSLGKQKRLVVYLSNLSVRRGGAVGTDGLPRSFGQAAVPEYEVRLIGPVRRLFNLLVPGVDQLPGPLRTLLLSDVDVDILAAPSTGSALEAVAPFMAVGSPGYNSASAEVEGGFSPLAGFVNDNAAIQLQGAYPIRDPRCGFVQRAIHPDRGQVAFYVAGISSAGTTAAVRYLLEQWRPLSKKYSTRPFCIMVRAASDDGSQHEVIYERG